MLNRKIKEILKNPFYLFLTLGNRGFFNWMSDETYLKIAYQIKLNKRLNLKEPKGYNEKLQWLKLNDYKPSYTKLVDKYEVRKYIKESIGEKYLIPLLGVWENFDDINFDELPNQFVLKCTHDSGSVIICNDKNNFNIKLARKKLNKCLKRNYYWGNRERPYKDIKPRIIAEKYIVDNIGSDLKDYKFFCFDGKVKAMFVASDRGIDTRFDFFDVDFNHLPFTQYYKNSGRKIVKPKNFEKMLYLAEKLSNGIPHVRVDFYNIHGKIYFGELTFYHFSGLVKFEPEEWDLKFGSWIDINNDTRGV